MKTQNRQFGKPTGSALILVVVVTVLLAVVGVMFLMVSRASELETAAVVQSADLDNAVDSVVARINEVLVEDLFGNNNQMVDNDGTDESYDAVTFQDRWLASLEPDIGIDGFGVPVYYWGRITDLYENNFGVPPAFYDPQDPGTDLAVIDPDQWNGVMPEFLVDASGTLVKVIGPKDRTYGIQQSAADWSYDLAGARADADGDGVADSRWVQVPGMTTSRGNPVFAAVRIIDNCAMLNLNTAHCFYQDSFVAPNPSPYETPWYSCVDDGTGTGNYDLQLFHDNESGSGRYLTELNYFPFLRGHDLNGNFFDGTNAGDNWSNLMLARGLTVVGSVTGFGGPHNVPALPKSSHAVFTNIENPVSGFQFFDVSDELELRNRYLVTSKVEARFERPDVANFSLDSGSTDYAALKVPRDIGSNTIDIWKERVDPANFDPWSDWLSPTGGLLPYKYDRRHVCTVYSYDRQFRRGDYPVLQPTFDILTATWTQQHRELAERVFWPVGPVTTNIETPFGLNASNEIAPYNNIETRRKILHLLLAFREYFHNQNGGDLAGAAKSAAQVVANMIDYSDDDAIVPTSPDRQGPFYDDGVTGPVDYGAQANVDCTFITEGIIQSMIEEVSGGLILAGTVPFGLDPVVDIVFGYEKQPFISEVYVEYNGVTGLSGFAIELLNPYSDDIKPKPHAGEPGWKIKIGDGAIVDAEIADDIFGRIPQYDTASQSLGRYVVRSSSSVSVDPNVPFPYDMASLGGLGSLHPGGNLEIQLLRPAPENSGVDYICVDHIPSDAVHDLFVDGRNALKRDDTNWKFVSGDLEVQNENGTPPNYTHTLGLANGINISAEGFQIGVADDGRPLTRWHELETLALYGNGPETSDPNAIQTVSSTLADPNTTQYYFDLVNDAPNILDYVATINRPDLGSLPGRININTAPVHVIAAAIPPTLADPNGSTGWSALDFARAIVEQRNTYGPFREISDLLVMGQDPNDPVDFQFYANDPNDLYNAGTQSIGNDIEEEHWVLSNLANKFTVRSDVFTAYILVRLGETGPQRRMIGIFDRSGVWQPTDRPRLVALHPVPDPR